jgi:protein TonB
MFESLVYVRKEGGLVRKLVSLPMALAVQAALLASFLLYSLLARDVLQPPERTWAALWNQAPRITLMGGAAAPRPTRPVSSSPPSPRDDRLRAPAQTPSEVRPAGSSPSGAEAAPAGPVIDGLLTDPDPARDSDLPPDPGPEFRRIVLAGATVRAPRLVVQVPPVYPPAARAMGISGRVVLRVVVDEEGRVEEVEVVSATNPLFVEPALEAVRRWRYSRPVDEGGQSVACSMSVTVTFALS